MVLDAIFQPAAWILQSSVKPSSPLISLYLSELGSLSSSKNLVLRGRSSGWHHNSLEETRSKSSKRSRYEQQQCREYQRAESQQHDFAEEVRFHELFRMHGVPPCGRLRTPCRLNPWPKEAGRPSGLAENCYPEPSSRFAHYPKKYCAESLTFGA